MVIKVVKLSLPLQIGGFARESILVFVASNIKVLNSFLHFKAI